MFFPRHANPVRFNRTVGDYALSPAFDGATRDTRPGRAGPVRPPTIQRQEPLLAPPAVRLEVVL
jgi:hypothetical protein